jgi:hypothetical protein
MEKIMLAKKKGVLLSDDIHEKLLKIQIDISYKTRKRVSLEKTIEHVLDNYKK